MNNEEYVEDRYQINLSKEEYDLLFDIINDYTLPADTIGLDQLFESMKVKILDPIDLNK